MNGYRFPRIDHQFNASKRARWLQSYAIAKRAFLCGACSYIDAVRALEMLGFGFEAKHKEVVEWLREQAAAPPIIIVSFDNEGGHA